MIDTFNDHYANEYAPSWLSCLDESMNSWIDTFCLGFMSVPREPHPPATSTIQLPMAMMGRQ